MTTPLPEPAAVCAGKAFEHHLAPAMTDPAWKWRCLACGTTGDGAEVNQRLVPLAILADEVRAMTGSSWCRPSRRQPWSASSMAVTCSGSRGSMRRWSLSGSWDEQRSQVVDLGQVAYEACRVAVDSDGDGPMQPHWGSLDEKARAHWRAAADGVRMMRWDLEDDCWLAIEDGEPIPADKLAGLPPWRAVTIARIAAKAGVPLERGTVGQLHAEARAVGGAGTLGPWWERAEQPT